jgi:hypothetical protein
MTTSFSYKLIHHLSFPSRVAPEVGFDPTQTQSEHQAVPSDQKVGASGTGGVRAQALNVQMANGRVVSPPFDS